MRRFLVPAFGLSLLALAGCSAGPSRDDAVERFAIELEHVFATGQDWTEAASIMADSALNGDCGRDSFRAALSDEFTQSAWDAGCLALFEADMNPEQIDRAARSVAGD